MPPLAGISGKRALKAFQKLGYQVIRQNGSHVRLKHPDSNNFLPLTLPMHRELKVGLLASALKDAKLTVEQFLELL